MKAGQVTITTYNGAAQSMIYTDKFEDPELYAYPVLTFMSDHLLSSHSSFINSNNNPAIQYALDRQTPRLKCRLGLPSRQPFMTCELRCEPCQP